MGHGDPRGEYQGGLSRPLAVLLRRRNELIASGAHALRELQKECELRRAGADGSRASFVFAFGLVLFEFLIADRIGMMLPRGGRRLRWSRRCIGCRRLGGLLVGFVRMVRTKVPAFAVTLPIGVIAPLAAVGRVRI